ncbi:hypothetical protein [Tateyamaria sp. ANG-S1]|uniref:hypothetical protein n=1 Tax=Tateyamaria sp. ANG-S1 TaxID=1577905 RepID=UPI00057CEB31|nr:hypothetical protein [Tateyamaria sp. ANG-S1]KIC50058.1 hypothetical protein RA29_10715 [Tateyamaria sp. ANG-S1]
MTFVELVIGFSIAFAIIAGALFFAFKTPRLKGPTRHNIRGNGDHATGHRSLFDGSDDGGD